MMNDEPQALAPSTFASQRCEKVRVGGFADQVVVLGGHHRQAQPVGGGVGFGPREAEAERVALRLRDGAFEFAGEVAEQARFARLQPAGVALLADRPNELEVGQAGYVVEVEPFAFGARLRDVGAAPSGPPVRGSSAASVWGSPAGRPSAPASAIDSSVAPSSRSSRHSVSG